MAPDGTKVPADESRDYERDFGTDYERSPCYPPGTMARRKARPSVPQGADPEAIALRIHQIAATAGVLAVAAARLDDHGGSLSHALYLIEETLLEVEQRVERLRSSVA